MKPILSLTAATLTAATLTPASFALRTRLLTALTLTALTLIPVASFANTPEVVVQEAINKIKTARSMEPVKDSIDWQSVYEKLGSEEKKLMKINNSEELKKRYLEDYTSGSEKDFQRYKEKYEKKRAKLSPQEKSSQLENLSRVEAELKNQKTKMSVLLSKTIFEVLSSEISEESATVKVKRTIAGQSEEIEIPLKKVSDEWKLLSAAALNPLSVSKGSGRNPFGKMPKPSQAVANP